MAPSLPPLPIAIVGAGMAGLSCAFSLAQAGHSVHVFDKSRGPSGRMSTRRGDGENIAGKPVEAWQCDHGAPSFSAHDADFRAQVDIWEQAGVAGRWQARIGRHDGENFSWEQEAAKQLVGIPRMTAPARHMVHSMEQLAMPVHLRWQTTVESLKRQDDGSWVVSNGQQLLELPRYQAVLLAIPAPQAAPLVAEIDPAAATLARQVHMHPCWAVMVRCLKKLPLPIDGCLVEQGPLRWIARDSSKPGRTGSETWLLHACPQWSQAHIDDDPQTVANTLVQTFAQLSGADLSGAQASAHRWRYANTISPLKIGSWWNSVLGLGMCGDWLQDGTVEGAWLSGRDLAQQIEKALRSASS